MLRTRPQTSSNYWAVCLCELAYANAQVVPMTEYQHLQCHKRIWKFVTPAIIGEILGLNEWVRDALRSGSVSGWSKCHGESRISTMVSLWDSRPAA